MVVDVGFPAVLLVHVPMGNVYVFQCGMVVLVRMGGKQMPPVLPLMQIVGDVVVLVPMLQGLVLVMTPLPCHRAHPLAGRRTTRNRPYIAR